MHLAKTCIPGRCTCARPSRVVGSPAAPVCVPTPPATGSSAVPNSACRSAQTSAQVALFQCVFNLTYMPARTHRVQSKATPHVDPCKQALQCITSLLNQLAAGLHTVRRKQHARHATKRKQRAAGVPLCLVVLPSGAPACSASLTLSGAPTC